jgi:hypothetical protein
MQLQIRIRGELSIFYNIHEADLPVLTSGSMVGILRPPKEICMTDDAIKAASLPWPSTVYPSPVLTEPDVHVHSERFGDQRYKKIGILTGMNSAMQCVGSIVSNGSCFIMLGSLFQPADNRPVDQTLSDPQRTELCRPHLRLNVRRRAHCRWYNWRETQILHRGQQDSLWYKSI